MRKPKYLSPSALNVYRGSPEAYYIRYLTDVRIEPEPQTRAMAVGSAFDAFVKSYLHKVIYGPLHPESANFDFDTLFEKQVEMHNRTFAMEAGAVVFRAYKSCGALGEIRELLKLAASPPMMEFISEKDIDGVIIHGRPDLVFVTEGGVAVVLDWKVNGYMSSATPVPGYVSILPGGACHKDCSPWYEGDILVNSANNIEENKEDWASQLSAYTWVCGRKVGEPMIVAVDQIVCDASRNIRVAQHRCEISEGYQRKVHNDFLTLWERIESGHFFPEMSLSDSISRGKLLEAKAQMMLDPEERCML